MRNPAKKRRTEDGAVGDETARTPKPQAAQPVVVEDDPRAKEEKEGGRGLCPCRWRQIAAWRAARPCREEEEEEEKEEKDSGLRG